MKRTSIKCQWHIIVIVVCTCLFSLLCWAGFAKSLSSVLLSYFIGSESTSTDKRTEAGEKSVGGNERPLEEQQDNKFALYANTLDKYVDIIDSAWYRCVFKKSYLSRVDSIYTYYTTGEIASSQVVKGEENWLFYKSAIDDDPIGDFEGTKKYTLTDMQNILYDALWTQEELEARGIKFTIIVAPNKENIYSEYMPDIYTHAEVSRTDMLIDFLADNGVNIITPKEELLDNHLQFQLYYSYDTHWNQLGAYIGVRDILESWNIDIPELEERIIMQKNLLGNYHYCGEDDLAQMIGLRESVFNDETEYEIEGTGLLDWISFADEQQNKEVSYYKNPDAQVQASVFLIGDSFRSSMVPALRETFSDVYVVYRDNYTADLLDQINPKYLIAEYVERYSSRIGSIDAIVK